MIHPLVSFCTRLKLKFNLLLLFWSSLVANARVTQGIYFNSSIVFPGSLLVQTYLNTFAPITILGYLFESFIFTYLLFNLLTNITGVCWHCSALLIFRALYLLIPSISIHILFFSNLLIYIYIYLIIYFFDWYSHLHSRWQLARHWILHQF